MFVYSHRRRQPERHPAGRESEAKANWLPEWHLMHTARWTAATDGTARTARTDRTSRTDAPCDSAQHEAKYLLLVWSAAPAAGDISPSVCVCVCVRAIDVQLAELPGCPGYSGAGPSLLSTMSYFIWAPRLNTLNVPHTHTHTPYTHRTNPRGPS